MTPAQLQTLRAAILSDTDQAVIDARTTRNDTELARLYNLPASPAFTVWKSSVSITEIGDKINGTELAGLSSLNSTRLQTVVVLSSGGVNPALSDRRAFFDDIFSGAGGTNTRANLAALWRRLATKAEKVFATGVGSDASPAVATFVGGVTIQDIGEAMNG